MKNNLAMEQANLNLCPKELQDFARAHLNPQDGLQAGVDMPLKEDVYRLTIWRSRDDKPVRPFAREVIFIPREGEPTEYLKSYIVGIVAVMVDSLKSEVAANGRPTSADEGQGHTDTPSTGDGVPAIIGLGPLYGRRP